MGVTAGTEGAPFTRCKHRREALQQSSGMEIPIKCFGCDGIPKIFDNARFIYGKLLPNKEDKDMEFPEESTGLQRTKASETAQNRNQGGTTTTVTMDQGLWQRMRQLGETRIDQNKCTIRSKLSPTPKNSPHTRMTLLASLKTR
jgi:hypothetical protein